MKYEFRYLWSTFGWIVLLMYKFSRLSSALDKDIQMNFDIVLSWIIKASLHDATNCMKLIACNCFWQITCYSPAIKNHMRLRLHVNIVLHATSFMQLVVSCKQAFAEQDWSVNTLTFFDWITYPVGIVHCIVCYSMIELNISYLQK
jgi:hypothetical protein